MAKDPALDHMTLDQVLAYSPILDLMQRTRYTVDKLRPILETFERQRSLYAKVAQAYAAEISAFEGVHSISSRVKSVGSLCEKILRKDDPRDPEVTADNYQTEIQDLIGIRALYVFPDEFAIVYQQILKRYKNIFDGLPTVRYRKGDNLDLFKKGFPNNRVIYPDTDDDYRSIHYLFHHEKPDVRIELQTRTIFEEGWSEINHRTVYGMKNSAKSDMLNILSPILSRMVGTSNDIASLIYSIAYRDASKLDIDDFDAAGAMGPSLVDSLAEFINNL